MDKYYIYFFPERGKENPAIKIGYSKDPIKRLKQLQTGSSIRIGSEGWLYVGENESLAREVEDVFHKGFKKHRIRENGEWFTYTDSIKSSIEKMLRNKEFTRYFE